MTIPTQQGLIAEFCSYVRDICAQPPEQQGNRLETVMARFGDSSVRIAASSMLEIDVDCAGWDNAALAEQMLRHVSFRAGKSDMLPAHCMMLEASKRLRPKYDLDEMIAGITDENKHAEIL